MFRLRSRIMLSFSLIIIIGTILMVLSVNFSTRRGYRTFVQKNDIDITRNLKDPLLEYYRVFNSWDGVETILQFPLNRQGQMRGMMGMMGRNPGSGAGQGGMFPLIVLTDGSGNILVSTDPNLSEEKIRYSKEELEPAQKLVNNNRTVGYVLAGSMIRKGLSENESLFLNRTISVIIGVSFLILAASMIFSWLLASRLSGPVTRMARAAGFIRSGDLSVRVPVKGRDELSELSASFNDMAISLEKNDQWRKQIIADSAHELRTPVSLIQGNLEMILEGLYMADEERIRNIYDETLVLSRLIEELQQLSSAESGSMTLNPEELDIGDLTDNVLKVFRAGAHRENITLKNNLEVPLPSVKGDYQKLKQVFANVLANAFRHTPAGGSIEIRGDVQDKNILIIIEDSGPGIPEEDLEKIFERFYRTDSARNRYHGGSGLGLAISREIVKLHGGEIYARSDKGKGALIFISLPII